MRTLVYHAHAKDVETVMVDGRLEVRDGTVVGEDEDALLEGAGRASPLCQPDVRHLPC